MRSKLKESVVYKFDLRVPGLFLSLGILSILFASHFPFLLADADSQLSTSRSPFTDEGLYTLQVRHLVNHNYLDLEEYDPVLKTPLFTAVLLPVYKIFGTQLWVSRILVLIAVFLPFLLLILNPSRRSFGVIGALLTLPVYYIFQFSHLGLVEMLSLSMLLLSLIILLKQFEKGFSRYDLKSLFLVVLLSSTAYWFKNQFLYTAAVIPATLVILCIVVSFINRSFHIQLFKAFLWSIFFSVLMLFVYYQFWYIPNKGLYKWIMSRHLDAKFAVWGEMKGIWDFFTDYYLKSEYFNLYRIVFIISLVVFAARLFLKRINPVALVIAIFSLVMIALESHKLFLYHLPPRYLLGMFFFMSLFVAVILNALYSSGGLRKLLVFVIIIGSLGLNFGFYTKSYNERSFKIHEIDTRLAEYNFANRPIMGQWAPALGWQSKARTIPVSYQYFNDTEIFEKYDPKLIITEHDEYACGGAFVNQGIDLNKRASWIEYDTIAKYKLVFYWFD